MVKISGTALGIGNEKITQRAVVTYLSVANVLILPLGALILQSQEVEIGITFWFIGTLAFFGAVLCFVELLLLPSPRT